MSIARIVCSLSPLFSPDFNYLPSGMWRIPWREAALDQSSQLCPLYFLCIAFLGLARFTWIFLLSVCLESCLVWGCFSQLRLFALSRASDASGLTAGLNVSLVSGCSGAKHTCQCSSQSKQRVTHYAAHSNWICVQCQYLSCVMWANLQSQCSWSLILRRHQQYWVCSRSDAKLRLLRWLWQVEKPVDRGKHTHTNPHFKIEHPHYEAIILQTTT